MPDFFQQLISQYLHSRPNAKKQDPKRVAKRLGVRKRDFDEFLQAWMTFFGAEGAVSQKDSKGRRGDDKNREAATTRDETGRLSGVIKRIGMRGGIFIPRRGGKVEMRPEGGPVEVQIATQDMHDAQVGDEVVVQLLSRRGESDKRYGRVVEVLERATNSFVGTYDEFDGQGYVKIDGRNFADPIWVGDPGAKGAAPGDKVIIEMLRFPTHAHGGEAVLTGVLGAKGEPGVDVQTIIHEYALPDEFPAEVAHEASKHAERFDEADLQGRLDLTHDTIITIDPADARDFDDAISLTKNEVGHWRLGVHIADVAHFVQPGSPLDREAKRRGTSVYLPTRVLPMLPEVISNGLASLQQGRVRYTNSVFIEFTPEGIPVDTEFAKSAIKVVQRFAYEEVLPVVQDSAISKTKVTAKVRQLLCDMHELAMTLRRRRFEKGSLDLNLPEVKLDFGKDGRVIGAHEAEHDESHQMIEEFMLAANIAVATKLNDLETAFLRRVHAEPDSLKLQAFAKFVATLGFSTDVATPEAVANPSPEKKRSSDKKRRGHSKSQTSNLKSVKSPRSPFDTPVILSKAALQQLLKQASGTPIEHAVNYALLRSLRQAEYSGVPIGHYALSVGEYCHFTSPIRRYPDLTIHRLFDEFTSGHHPRGPSDAELEILGMHCSDTERRAAQAERELTKLKLLEFMSDKIGDEFDAVITGVERFGLFCQGLQMPVDGFVHISALSENDYYNFDPDSFSLIGRATGTQFRLGDRVRVQIAAVDEQRRELDFRIVLGKQSRKLPRGESQAVRSDRQPKDRQQNKTSRRGGPK